MGSVLGRCPEGDVQEKEIMMKKTNIERKEEKMMNEEEMREKEEPA